MPRQADLASAADMKQSRISMMETPGAANMTLDTLGSIAAALKVGLKVEFVPFSEMLAWENGFSQDKFDVVKIDSDIAFLNPTIAVQVPKTTPVENVIHLGQVPVTALKITQLQVLNTFTSPIRLGPSVKPCNFDFVTERGFGFNTFNLMADADAALYQYALNAEPLTKKTVEFIKKSPEAEVNFSLIAGQVEERDYV
jgi:hypothetical protein